MLLQLAHVFCANEIVLEANRRNLNDIILNLLCMHFHFGTIKELVHQQEWDKVAELIVASVNKLKKIGADFIILPVNKIHFAIEQIAAFSPLPILNLLDITVEECVRRNFKKVGVLGTKLTMQHGLYDNKLVQQGIIPIIPEPSICDKNSTLNIRMKY